MLIRSQDKKTIVNLDNIDTVIVSTHGEIDAFNEHSKTKIAEYSTEEKAIKVLDMIQDAYLNANHYYDNSSSVLNAVFQMPQDSEV